MRTAVGPVCLIDMPRNTRHVPLGLVETHARFQARNQLKDAGRAGRIRADHKRRPNFRWRSITGRKLKSSGHHSDHREGGAIEHSPGADDVRVRSKTAAPKRVAEQHNVFVSRFSILGNEGAAKNGCGAEQWKKIRGHARARYSLRLLRRRQIEIYGAKRRHVIEDAVGLPVVEVIGK